MNRWPLLILFFSMPALLNAQGYDSIPDPESHDEGEMYYEGEEETYDTAQTYTLAHPNDLEQTEKYKSGKLRVRSFDEKTWKEIVGNTDYNESPDHVTPEDQSGVAPWNVPWDAAALRPLAYILIAGAVALILYYVLKNINLDLKIKRSDTSPGETTPSTAEDLQALDFEELLRRARSEGNYRLAIRFCYLELLKALHAGGYIHWKKDKTNSEYLSELFTVNSWFDEVRALTLAYEQVWYGERALTSDSFQRLSGYFEKLRNAIGKRDIT